MTMAAAAAMEGAGVSGAIVLATVESEYGLPPDGCYIPGLTP